MNKSKALKLSSYADEPSLPVLDADLILEQGENTPVAGQSLFLAWSNAASQSNVTMRQDAVPLSSSLWGKGWDTGLWFLDDPSVRRRGWAQLNEIDLGSDSFRLLSRPGYAAAKRAIDVILSFALLILLLPLFVLIAVAVRLDSPGPAIFRQRRIGWDGEEFLLWKFRSMRTDAPKYAPSPASTLDPRLTRIGRLIRRISVDELPQLINVLRGEMSLVGPRPEMPFIVDSYSSLERKRLAVKPGITGLWQVSPARAFPIHENLQYDLHYIHHQNLMLDGAILLCTVAAVIRGIGAV
jgi:lipopolysaccharide/colanic/teichoic acid biosynthesis glycosyltransferase